MPAGLRGGRIPGFPCTKYRLDRLLQEAQKTLPERAENAEAQPVGPHGGSREQGAYSTLKRGSTQADYLARRIARDRPDVLARMKLGEFPYLGPFCNCHEVSRVP